MNYRQKFLDYIRPLNGHIASVQADALMGFILNEMPQSDWEWCSEQLLGFTFHGEDADVYYSLRERIAECGIY